jgi:hypothetical protein
LSDLQSMYVTLLELAIRLSSGDYLSIYWEICYEIYSEADVDCLDRIIPINMKLHYYKKYPRP